MDTPTKCLSIGILRYRSQQPRRLLCVVKLCGAARLLSEDVVDILEGLFEQAD
jgi:hypothetical protein